MAYHNVLFPKEISYGSKGGPAFKTTVITLASGLERRNQEWKRVRAIYDVSHGIKSPAELEELRSFFYARRGMANSFNYFDWGDHEIVTQNIGIGDGIKRNFQIIKSYVDDGNDEPICSYSCNRNVGRRQQVTVFLIPRRMKRKR